MFKFWLLIFKFHQLKLKSLLKLKYFYPMP
uniref:Uncharacterized protein n=1 Tax=Podoviridae sp. ctWeH21 TaxID=2825255 RepID=A0A8S5PFB6_9CAUD|nr:MAG TPA: hypothetical protein [Podoviridae sp. ctWeH21]